MFKNKILLVSIILILLSNIQLWAVESSKVQENVNYSELAPEVASSIIIEDKPVTKIKKEKRTIKKFIKGVSGNKSQLFAFLLCLFFGGLGLHRFYLGYWGWGIIYFFTGGFFGIGYLVDLIRLIIPGGLKPKDGSYKN